MHIETFKHTTREAWLNAAVEALRGDFKRHAATYPETIRVSCGWPGGRGSKLKAIGQYWPEGLAADKIPQMFISPALAEPVGAAGILPTLVHELVHAAEPTAGHGKVFKKLALAVGLEGKMRATTASAALQERLNALATELGPYPHGKLTLGGRAIGQPKKDTARMIKVACGDCGYTVRTTRKWLSELGAPFCPCRPSSPWLMVEAGAGEGGDE